MAIQVTDGAKNAFKIILIIAGVGLLWFAAKQGVFDPPAVQAPVVLRNSQTIAPKSTTSSTQVSAQAPMVAPKASVLIPAAGMSGRISPIRFATLPWNTAMGAMFANGGPRTQEGSLMDKSGIRLTITRQDDYSVMKSDLIAFAQAFAKGEDNPTSGVHFVNIMGNGAPNFLAGLNKELQRLGSEYVAEVVGMIGYSRGEDKCMGTPDMMQNGKINPAALKGSLIAEVQLDGDQDLCFSLAADNGVGVNPDETVFDPDRMNFISTATFVDAGKLWIAGHCVDLPESKDGVRTGQTVHKCLGESGTGVATWTPGDETVVVEKGNLISLASTKEYAYQMPATVIGIKKWNVAHRDSVERMLTAMYAGAERVQQDHGALMQAAEVSAQVYNEKDAAYWARLYVGDTATDAKTGMPVAVGGSFTAGLGDAAHAYGLLPGATNLVAEAYTSRGVVASTVYPELLPKFPSAQTVINTSYVQNLVTKAADTLTQPTLPQYPTTPALQSVVADKDWRIQFNTGKATFTSQAIETLQQLQASTALAGGMRLEIVGHTDNVGNDQANMTLSEKRARAVKAWLQQQSPVNYPENRFIIIAKGETDPHASNDTEAGRAQNRSVEIMMGQ
jgi:OmpA-OmpF porin, OOP family